MTHRVNTPQELDTRASLLASHVQGPSMAKQN